MPENLENFIKRAAKKHGVPGASVAVLRGQRIVSEVATGVINRNTKVRATTDTVFQIGSITKTFTASIIMQLRDEGLLDLDDPIVKYLPDFKLTDMKRLRKVTLRHLLTHQSGIDGDFFPMTDTGDNAIKALLEKARSLPFLFEPGTNYSYCNIGFSALGRVIEVLDQQSFDRSIRKRIFDPLDMNHALSRPEDTLRFRAAVGHLPDPQHLGQLMVPKNMFLTIGHKAAGATPAMTAADLLKYAAVHMNKGVGLNGNRILTAKSVREMQKPLISHKNKDWPWQLGLTWRLAKWGESKIYGHPGGTVGQASSLEICNEKDIAVACLTNGGNGADFNQEVIGHVFKTVKVKMFTPPKPNNKVQLKTEMLTGRYKSISATIDITEQAGKLRMTATPPGFAGLGSESDIGLVNRQLAITSSKAIEFDSQPGQPCEWIRIAGRLLPRV